MAAPRLEHLWGNPPSSNAFSTSTVRMAFLNKKCPVPSFGKEGKMATQPRGFFFFLLLVIRELRVCNLARHGWLVTHNRCGIPSGNPVPQGMSCSHAPGPCATALRASPPVPPQQTARRPMCPPNGGRRPSCPATASGRRCSRGPAQRHRRRQPPIPLGIKETSLT